MCFAPVVQTTSANESCSEGNQNQVKAIDFLDHVPSQNPFRKSVQAPFLGNVVHYYPFNSFKLSGEFQNANANPYSLNPQTQNFQIPSKGQEKPQSGSSSPMQIQKDVKTARDSREKVDEPESEVQNLELELAKPSDSIVQKAMERRKLQAKQVENVKKMIKYGKEKKPTGIIPCKFFMKGNGRCKYGNNCRFSHVHFYPMPTTFSEDPIAQKHLRCTVEAVNQKENAARATAQTQSTSGSIDTTSCANSARARFNWNSGDIVYREAVHYSSESSDSPTSKVCSAVLKILQESEEYQRIEVICQREKQKHVKYFENMSPAFVGSSLIIMIQLKVGVSVKDLPMAIPSCIDGVKTQVTFG